MSPRPPRLRRRPAIVAAVLVAALISVGAWLATGSASAGTLSGTLYRDPNSAVVRWVAANPNDVEPTDRELRKIYDAAVQQQKQAGKTGGEQQKIPPFVKVKPQLAEQAKAENEGKVAQALVEELREDADITINL